ARPHIVRVTRACFEQAEVTLFPWPPRSPDLSPIEHVWDIIGRRLGNLLRPPQTLDELRHQIQVTW
ncbi:DDE 3 domain containing protein, partial [Asbolus verrucosus]